MTIRQIRLGSRKWNISIGPTLNVGLLVMMVFLSSVLACSKEKEEGDPKTLNYSHYCPDVPAGVSCPSGSGDNSTTSTPNGSIVTNQFLYGTTTSYGAGKMYWGLYKASKDYWYIDPNNKIRKGCMPTTLSYDNGTTFPHYSLSLIHISEPTRPY